jgi:hypothetical protein
MLWACLQTYNMLRNSRQTAGGAAELLKTCNTCFRAKIRCDRSEESGPCDRCLRLEKDCIFAPRRHNHKSRVRYNRTLDKDVTSSSIQDVPLVNKVPVPRDEIRHSRPRPPQTPVSDVPDDPLVKVREWCDEEMEARLLQLFQTSMSPRFPFIMLPEGIKPEHMGHRPCAYTAILAVACSEDFVLQRALSQLFNQTLQARLSNGRMASLDVLQGVLLHLAWSVTANPALGYSVLI